MHSRMKGQIPATYCKENDLAERGGFEPPVQLLTVQRFSKPPPSATRPPLRRVFSVVYYMPFNSSAGQLLAKPAAS